MVEHQDLLIEAEPLPIPKHHQFRKAWRWPHTIEAFFLMLIEGLYSLHVCCGQSSLGTERIDLDPASKRTKEGDMRDIPFPNDTFDRVFCDWPWKLNYFQRFKPFYEMIRVCKVGGLIIVNATWIPHSKAAKLIDCFIRCDSPFGMASVILVYQKISNAYDRAVTIQEV